MFAEFSRRACQAFSSLAGELGRRVPGAEGGYILCGYFQK
jgi:hypothetical protein